MSVRRIDDLEREAITKAMVQFGPRRKSEAASALGISLKTLYVRLRKYELTQYLRNAGRP